MKINGNISDLLSSSDEELLVIGASLLDSESITDEERKYWIDEYVKRMMDKGWDINTHGDSLKIMYELNKQMRQKNEGNI